MLPCVHVCIGCLEMWFMTLATARRGLDDVLHRYASSGLYRPKKHP